MLQMIQYLLDWEKATQCVHSRRCQQDLRRIVSKMVVNVFYNIRSITQWLVSRINPSDMEGIYVCQHVMSVSFRAIGGSHLHS